MLKINKLSSSLLPEISFSVSPGQCVAIHGESGSGKTLLLRAIADLDPNIADIELNSVKRDQYLPQQWRQEVAYLPAESHWWSDHVKEHFLHDFEPEKLGLSTDILNWNVSRLSTGEKQRLALLRSLDRKPSVLMLDEVTANLDENNTQKVEQLITATASSGLAVILVSHDALQRARIADISYRIGASGLIEDR